MNEGKWISVIIPCYNAEMYIERCISSLVAQTIGIENLELIFVNDASDDNTINYLREWEIRYPDSIVVIDCENNRRTGGARNIGLRRACGKYIGFMDNDDEIEPEMYEMLYNAAEKYQCDVVSCLYERISEDGILYPLEMPAGKEKYR